MEKINTSKKEDIQELKSLLSMKINQQKMLNNTLCEIMSKNYNSDSINQLKEEIRKVMDEIYDINLKISNLENKDDEVTYSFYDDKVKLNNVNLEKNVKEIISEKNFYNSIAKKKENVQFNEELKNTFDLKRAKANHFLVDLKEVFNIPELMVKSVSFDLERKMVSINMYDFVTEFHKVKYPIMQLLKSAPIFFNFSIKRLDDYGNLLYVEKYFKCNLMEIYKDPIDYTDEDFSKIQLVINYNNVEYETS